MNDTSKASDPSFVFSVAVGSLVACPAGVLFYLSAWIVWRLKYAEAGLSMPMPHTEFVAWFWYGIQGITVGAGCILVVATVTAFLAEVGRLTILRLSGRREVP